MSWSTFNQSLYALRFFYGTTLGRTRFCPSGCLPHGKKPKRVPLVLSRDEIVKLLQCDLPSRKQRMVLTTMYATGLRVGEAVRDWSVNDIEQSRRMTIPMVPPAAKRGTSWRDWCPCHRKLLTELRLFLADPSPTRCGCSPVELPDQHLSIGLLVEKSCESRGTVPD